MCCQLSMVRGLFVVKSLLCAFFVQWHWRFYSAPLSEREINSLSSMTSSHFNGSAMRECLKDDNGWPFVMVNYIKVTFYHTHTVMYSAMK